MADTLTPEQRRLNMSRIRGRDTALELTVRRGLHALGWRYRLHDRALPGTPDLSFPRRRAIIFVHGCFWHGHDCPLFKLPASNTEVWADKITKNRERDFRAVAANMHAGWRIMTIWECALRGRGRRPVVDVIAEAASWLAGDQQCDEIAGAWSGD